MPLCSCLVVADHGANAQADSFQSSFACKQRQSQLEELGGNRLVISCYLQVFEAFIVAWSQQSKQEVIERGLAVIPCVLLSCKKKKKKKKKN